LRTVRISDVEWRIVDRFLQQRQRGLLAVSVAAAGCYRHFYLATRGHVSAELNDDGVAALHRLDRFELAHGGWPEAS
jgi:hypothetical protein